jgi:hypothetical protein
MTADRMPQPRDAAQSIPLQRIEVEPVDADARMVAMRGEIRAALAAVLEPLEVKFKFAIQPRAVRLGDPQAREIYRISILCIGKTNWQCELLATPLATALRNLGLVDCQDAVIKFSQRGDTKPQWRLRVDLTPAVKMLGSWARWGDVQAITHLLNLQLAASKVKANTVLKNLTLHIHCHLDATADPALKFPGRQVVLSEIVPLLEQLKPQGIQSATIYGIQSQPHRNGQIVESTIWTHWLDLAGAKDLGYTLTPLLLAEQGDIAALTFILQRFLNPDLEQYLNGGGIKISLMQRRNLLHIMSEAIVCPLQSQVAVPTVKVLRQLALPGQKGVRIYGRVIGQRELRWSYGMDFEAEQNALPSQVQENFAQRVGIPPTPPPTVTQRWIDGIANRLTATPIWQPQTASLIQIPAARHVLAVALAGCAIVVGIDRLMPHALGIKPVVSDLSQLLPESDRLDFNNSLLVQKIDRYQKLYRAQGRPDVLIVGSSRALRGVNPEILRQNLIARGYPAMTIYNLGINGATAQVVDVILRQLLTPEQLPKLVIWVDGARAFNSGRADRTFESIALSRSYRQIALQRDGNKPLTQAQTSVKNSAQAIDTIVDRSLANLSASYQHRDRLKSWLQSQTPRIKIDRIADSSSSPAIADLPPSIQDSDVNDAGFLPLDLKFDPTIYYQKYLKVAGDSDGDYANFQLTGNQSEATLKTIQLLAARKIPLVFVNAPLSDLYLDSHRRRKDAEFTKYMQDLAQTHQLTFLDLASAWEQRYDRFSDPSHINQYGAEDLSRQIAASDEIPWKTIE